MACLVLASCGGPSYPPPPQRQFDFPPEPIGFVTVLNMGAPESAENIVSGISPRVEGVGWRWTREQPRLSFLLPHTRGWTFSMDFGFPARNFRDTGPVTVTFLVNGRVLEKVRYTQPGDQHFEKAVPEEWLNAGEQTQAGADIDPPWIAPRDKARLGFVLYRAGFLP